MDYLLEEKHNTANYIQKTESISQAPKWTLVSLTGYRGAKWFHVLTTPIFQMERPAVTFSQTQRYDW